MKTDYLPNVSEVRRDMRRISPLRPARLVSTPNPQPQFEMLPLGVSLPLRLVKCWRQEKLKHVLAGQSGLRPTRPGVTTSHSHYAAPDRPALLHSTLTQYSPISRHGPVPAWSQVITAASSCPPTRRPDCSLQHSAAPAASPRPVLMQFDFQSKGIRKSLRKQFQTSQKIKLTMYQIDKATVISITEKSSDGIRVSFYKT